MEKERRKGEGTGREKENEQGGKGGGATDMMHPTDGLPDPYIR